MKQKRLLLPFTHGVNMQAIEQAVQLAKKEHALLMPLSLLPSHESSNRLRFEHIQQSKDFLEAVKHKAERYGVSVEPFELHADHPAHAIIEFAHKHKTSSIMIFIRDGKGVLLSTNQVRHLLEKPASRFYIVELPSPFSKRLLKKVINTPVQLVRRLSGRTTATAEGNAVEPPSEDLAQV